MASQPEGLISVLLDSSATEAERDDAAMDLAIYDDSEALQALLKVATTEDEEEIFMDVCGESIAEIWIRNESFDPTACDKLKNPARKAVLDMIVKFKLEWIERYNLDQNE